MKDVGKNRVVDNPEKTARWNAVTLATRAIESRVAQLDKWAEENAAKQDYTGAGSQQKAAVDLHCAVALVVDGVIGQHVCALSGFNGMIDTCERCEWEAAQRHG